MFPVQTISTVGKISRSGANHVLNQKSQSSSVVASAVPIT